VLNALTGSFTGQLTLYFSQPRKQAHHQRSKLPKCLGVDQPVQCSDVDALLLKVMEAVDHLHLSSTKPVKFCYY
jgi:hypothetical protein